MGGFVCALNRVRCGLDRNHDGVESKATMERTAGSTGLLVWWIEHPRDRTEPGSIIIGQSGPRDSPRAPKSIFVAFAFFSCSFLFHRFFLLFLTFSFPPYRTSVSQAAKSSIIAAHMISELLIPATRSLNFCPKCNVISKL